MNVKFEVTGLKELQVAFGHLRDEFTTAVAEGLNAGSHVLADGCAQRAPVDPQHRIVRRGKSYPKPLHASFRWHLQKQGREQWSEVGPGAAFWGRFQERGTRYQPARHFMKDTVEQDGPRAVEAFTQVIKVQFDGLVRRARVA
jgi:HK97 gp10 family phage protein